jgi:phosphopantetheinyl transferase
MTDINKSIPLKIDIRDYIRDHQFNGKIVVPAVEEMQILASALQSIMPDINLKTITSAAFSRFIEINPEQKILEAIADFNITDSGVAAALSTIKSSKDGSIKRKVENAKLNFNLEKNVTKTIPLDTACIIEGPVTEITPDKLYEDLVPFLKSYRNAVEKIYISQDGAMGSVSGENNDYYPGPLGSPFPLDAAFHIACVWGQRYCGFTGFPVAFDKRNIYHQTEKNAFYHARIIPVSSDKITAYYDIHIYSMDGILMESVYNLKMSDVTAGKLKAPEWISAGLSEEKRLTDFLSQFAGYSIVEVGKDTQFSKKTFSDEELERSESMADKRNRSFTSARLALKLLYRKLTQDYYISPEEINTVDKDHFPVCGNFKEVNFSVSHDSRFAIAIADKHNIGVDVEEISDRVNKTKSTFMNEDEIKIVEKSDNPVKASLRIWSVKECAVKAFRSNLADAWKEAVVTETGKNISRFIFNDKIFEAEHFEFMGHLFTVVSPHPR